MIKGFFKKDDLHHDNHKRLNTLESSLKNSFFNIKKDVFKITTSISHHDNHLSHLKERLDRVESLMHEFQRSIANLNSNPRSERISEKPTLIKEEKPLIPSVSSSSNPNAVLDHLTEVQKNLLLRLGTLLAESNTSWVTLKFLTEDLYPDKSYNSVRPMISEYIDLLMDFGLVKKIRKGRISYITITERGIAMFDKAKQKKLLEIVQ